MLPLLCLCCVEDASISESPRSVNKPLRIMCGMKLVTLLIALTNIDQTSGFLFVPEFVPFCKPPMSYVSLSVYVYQKGVCSRKIASICNMQHGAK